MSTVITLTMTANTGSVLLSCQIHQIAVALHDIAVIFRLVGQQALGAILDALGGIGKAAAALVAQSVQGAVAEQAVELAVVGYRMTGEELTFPMLEKGVFFAFPIRLIRHNCDLLGDNGNSIPLYRVKVKGAIFFQNVCYNRFV